MAIYRGYKISSRLLGNLHKTRQVTVSTRGKYSRTLFLTNSVELAERWVDGYRDGEQWAVDAARKPAA